MHTQYFALINKNEFNSRIVVHMLRPVSPSISFSLLLVINCLSDSAGGRAGDFYKVTRVMMTILRARDNTWQHFSRVTMSRVTWDADYGGGVSQVSRSQGGSLSGLVDFCWIKPTGRNWLHWQISGCSKNPNMVWNGDRFEKFGCKLVSSSI